MSCFNVFKEELDANLPNLREPAVSIWKDANCQGALRFPLFKNGEQQTFVDKFNKIDFKDLGIGSTMESIVIPPHMSVHFYGFNKEHFIMYPNIVDRLSTSVYLWDTVDPYSKKHERIRFDDKHISHIRLVPIQPWSHYLVGLQHKDRNFTVISGNDVYEKRLHVNNFVYKDYCDEDPTRKGCGGLRTLNALREQYPKSWRDICLNHVAHAFDVDRDYLPIDARICQKDRCFENLELIYKNGELDPDGETLCNGVRYRHELIVDFMENPDSLDPALVDPDAPLRIGKILSTKESILVKLTTRETQVNIGLFVGIVILSAFLVYFWLPRLSSQASVFEKPHSRIPDRFAFPDHS